MSLEKYPTDTCCGGSCQGLPKDGEIPPVDNYPPVTSGSIFVGSGGSSADPWPYVPPPSPDPWPNIPTFDPTIFQKSFLPELVPTRIHRLWLRDDFEVEIKLPADLTSGEMVRLQDFVGLLHCRKPEPSKEEW